MLKQYELFKDMIVLTKRLFSFLIIITLLLSTLCGCNSSKMPEDFSLTTGDLSFTTQGDTATIYQGEISFDEINWGSDDEAVATFKDGVVTAQGIGTTRVFAEYFGIQYNCYVDCSSLIYTHEFLESVKTDENYSGSAVLKPPKSIDEPSSFFDDAVFIGDSISLKLSYYAEATKALGKAQFLVSGSFGVAHAVEGTMDLFYQGKDMTPTKAIAASKAKKVFVMLGMNDISLYGVDKTMEYWKTFVDDIKETCPDVSICIQSMTPVYKKGQVGDLTNKNIDKYNEKLKAFAAENGCSFMDIASFMKDKDGALASDYCSDEFVHLTDAGAYAWTNVLNAYIEG